MLQVVCRFDYSLETLSPISLIRVVKSGFPGRHDFIVQKTPRVQSYSTCHVDGVQLLRADI